jgi:excisionase family DNA binding protein
MLAMPPPPVERSTDLLTAQQVAYRLAVSVRTVWRMLERNELPKPVRYNRKLVRWRTRDIERYVEALQ